MSHLHPLVATWIIGAVLLLLDGRKPRVLWSAVVALAAVAASNALALARIALGGDAMEVTAGGWPAGVGIRLRVDVTSAFFSTLVSVVLAGALAHEARAEMRSRLFPAFVFLLAAGLQGAFVTRDLFNLYVFFELSVMASFALSAYGYGRGEVRGAFNYVAMNLVGSVVFLTGVAAAYHATGTLDFAELSARAATAPKHVLSLSAALLFAGFSVKLGLFPFHGWVPVLYSHAQPSVAAALGGALVNIGAYGLLRLGFTVMEAPRASAAGFLVGLGLVATLYGGLLAVQRRRPAEVAAYTAIVHAGYVVLALGLGGTYGIAAIVLTALAGSIDKSIMFLSTGAGGATRTALAFVAGASLAGIPLTAGFLSKVALFRAALESPNAWAVVTALVASAALAIVAGLRFARMSREADDRDRPVDLVALAMCAVTVAAGLAADPLVGLAGRIGDAVAGGGM